MQCDLFSPLTKQHDLFAVRAAAPAPVEFVWPTCPFCDDEWEGGWSTHYGCDVETNDSTGEEYVTWTPCCMGIKDIVEDEGFEAAYGRSLESIVGDICPATEILDVVEDFFGHHVVARLQVLDPTEDAGDDGKGHRRAKSPKGWRGEVFEDVDKHHRHHPAPQGHKFSVATYNGSAKVGVAVVGRPVSRRLQEAEPNTLEVTRVCVWGPSPRRKNAASKLYGAAAKRAKALGYDKLVTYTLADEESGHSLLASGFVPVRKSAGGSWSRSERHRADKAPTGHKIRWERGLTKKARRSIKALV